MAENFNDAKENLLSGVLSGAKPGDDASAQTEGEINNVHTSSAHPYPHVDSTEATKQEDNSVTFDKGHSGPDEPGN